MCDACGKVKHEGKDLLKCSRCRQAFYHDKTCQKNHWSKHKKMCKKMVEQKEEEALQMEHIKVIETSTKGRVALAKKDFSPGEQVLLESPAIYFDTGLAFYGILEAFGSATKETQERLLGLHAPPLSQIDSEARRRRYAHLEEQRQTYLRQHPEQVQSVTLEIAQKLLAIVETNAYQLFNADLGGSGKVNPDQWMGLFILASMPEHSCNPNVTMNTTCDGKVELIAETRILKGERIAFSYAEGIYEKNRDQRQKQLLADKHFVCQCDRCKDVDECRPILLHATGTTIDLDICQSCGACHPLFWHSDAQQYICIMDTTPNNIVVVEPDRARLSTALRMESESTQQLEHLERTLQDGGESVIDNVLLKLAALMTGSQWEMAIHPLHHLQVSAHTFLSTTAAAIARILQQQQQRQISPRMSSFLRLSVLALLHNIVWAETMVRMLRSPKSKKVSSYLSLQHTLTTVKAGDNTLVIIKRALTSCLANADKNGSFTVEESELRVILKLICDTPSTTLDEEQCTTADSLLTAFYAGQDLLLAGHVDLCLLLYQRYYGWFHKLKQPSDDNRTRIDRLISSQGRNIPFDADLI